MNKKRLQRLGVACMAAAMVFTTVNFPSVAKADVGGVTQADKAASPELEKGKILVKVNQDVLKANATTNSIDLASAQWKGYPSLAFDGDTGSLWVSRWDNTVCETWIKNNALYSAENPWIGSSFGGEIMLKKIVYINPRTNNDNIKGYNLYTRTDDTDWQVVATGTLKNEANTEQEIILPDAVKAKYFKLEATSNYRSNSSQTWASCGELKVYEEKDIDITLAAPGQNSAENVTSSTDEKDAEQQIFDASGNSSISGGFVTGKNAFDLHNRMTVTTNNVGNFTSTNSKYIIQAKLNLKNYKSGTGVVIASKGNEYGVLVRYSNSHIYVSIGCTHKDGNKWLEAGLNVEASEIFDKEVLVTGVRDGNKMKIWFGDKSAERDYGSAFDVGSVSNTLTIGNLETDGVMGEVRDVKIVNCAGVSEDIISTRPDADAMVAAGGQYVLDLNGIPATTTSYTATTTTEKSTVTDPETSTEKNTYTTTTTIAPAGDSQILTAPEAVTVNIDGNTADNKVVPVSEDSTLATDGTATVKYVFEDMLRGGSLRMIKENGKTDYEKTSMRFGYDFKLPTGTTFDSCEWYYGTNADNLELSLAPGAATKKIENPTETKQGYIRSNIVFTNIAKDNFDRNIYARVLVNYTKDGKTYSKMGAYVDQNSVNSIAKKIKANGSETERAYVEKLTASN